MKRQRYRRPRVTPTGNLLVRIIGKPPLELLKEATCPYCHSSYYDCDHLNHLTLDQLAQQGYARYVEQE
jgi:hypothetical protein